MKTLLALLCCCASFFCQANELKALDAPAIKAAAEQFLALENKAFTKGSTAADLDALFALYTDDFTYVHEVYGGTYTRADLYNNALRNLKAGRYEKSLPPFRGTTGNILTGLNAVAIQRTENGRDLLTVVEFRGEKISRVIEYWR